MGCYAEPLAVGTHRPNSSVLMSQQGLMRDLEEKEKELNKLKLKADGLLNNNHPASDKIQVKYLVFVVIIRDKRSACLARLILCAPPGLHGHLTDAVELAPPDHQVHPCSSKGECCLQPSWCFFPTLAFVWIEPGEHFSFCLLQFFKEANETYTKLQKEHESIRSKFTCNKSTPMENLVDLLKNLEVWKSGIKVFPCLKGIAGYCCVWGGLGGL